MKVQLFIDPENKLSRVPYQVPNNIHYVKYQDYLDAQTQPDALTAYLYAAELAKDDIKKLKAEVERLKQQVQYWKVEAECDHGRWLRCLEDLEKLRKECHRDADQKS